MDIEGRKQASVQFLKLIVAGQIEKAYQKYVDLGGKHHNTSCSSGFPALQESMIDNHALFPNKRLVVEHVLGDKEYVAVHSHITLNPGGMELQTVHVFRFHADKIVELWDCGQEVPADSPNEDGAF
ncbi:MAG TPA: nuclear transport factor 2 family protein [Candidatus Lokiarchaeia archaeon]|nr:nuclear transport factor 2 family protein [Candidatus Lokiarchaeia archaeon]